MQQELVGFFYSQAQRQLGIIQTTLFSFLHGLYFFFLQRVAIWNKPVSQWQPFDQALKLGRISPSSYVYSAPYVYIYTYLI